MTPCVFFCCCANLQQATQHHMVRDTWMRVDKEFTNTGGTEWWEQHLAPIRSTLEALHGVSFYASTLLGSCKHRSHRALSTVDADHLVLKALVMGKHRGGVRTMSIIELVQFGYMICTAPVSCAPTEAAATKQQRHQLVACRRNGTAYHICHSILDATQPPDCMSATTACTLITATNIHREAPRRLLLGQRYQQPIHAFVNRATHRLAGLTQRQHLVASWVELGDDDIRQQIWEVGALGGFQVGIPGFQSGGSLWSGEWWEAGVEEGQLRLLGLWHL